MIEEVGRQHKDAIQETGRVGEDLARTREAVHLLDDLPLNEDRFEGKAHDAVASAVAGLIASEPGGRVIGLEGAWGSGKSTIVKLVTAHLESVVGSQDTSGGKEGIRVLVFDAWAHQGDPLRRTFLETLITDLKQWKWMSPGDADRAKKQLTGKTATTHTVTTPHLTLEGRITSVTALMVPLGVTIFATHLSRHQGGLLCLGILLSLAPIVAITLLWGLAWLRRTTWDKDAGPLRLFAEEHETNTTTESIESGEPTSVEFEGFFKDILGKAVQEGRRLLLVLDNLDRVRQEDALAIFATMQTFTSSSLRSSAEPWRRRVWTLIPYDRAGLDSLWDAAEEEVGENPQGAAPVSAAFLDKLFDIRFITPPLVLSNWRDYLAGLLKEALPEREDSEFQQVVRLRALYPESNPSGRVAREQPTPRQLKQFVNSVGAILRQRSDIPVLDVAYFSLLQRDRIDLSTALLASEIPPHRLHFMFAGQVRENLAALFYGTPTALGGQLLLRGPIEDALGKPDANALKDLSELSGFADAIDSLDLPARASSGGVELTRMVAVLADSQVIEIPGLSSWVRDCLLPEARSPEVSWQLAGRESGRGLAALCRLFSEETDQANLLARILPIYGNGEKNAISGLEGLGALASALDDRLDLVREARVTLEIPEEDLVESLAYYRSQVSDPAALGILDLTIDATRVSELVAAALTSEDPSQAVEGFEVLASRPERFSQEVLLSNCLTWLRDQSAANAEQLEAVLQMVDTLRSPSDLVRVQEIADDGTLMHHLAYAHAREWITAAASAIMLFLVARDCTVEPQAVREAASGVGVLRQALHDPPSEQPLVDAQRDWLSNHRSEAVELLIRQEDADGSIAPWVNVQVSELYRSAALDVSPHQLVTYFRSLKRGLDPAEFEELVAQTLRAAENRKIVIAQSRDPELALCAVKSVGSQAGSKKKGTNILRWAGTIVQETTHDTWSAALASKDGGPVIELALALVESGQKPEVGGDLDEAVREHAGRLEDGQEGWEPSGADFLRLTSLLSSAAQKTLASQLVSGLEGRDGEIAEVFFEVFGEFLSSHKEARTHDKLPGVVTRLVANDQWEAVGWFVKLAKAHKDVLNRKGRENAFTYLDERVAERVDSDEGDPKPAQLVDLESALGLSPRDKEK